MHKHGLEFSTLPTHLPTKNREEEEEGFFLVWGGGGGGVWGGFWGGVGWGLRKTLYACFPSNSFKFVTGIIYDYYYESLDVKY